MADEPPSLPVGTGVSAKYKGAFCEAKIRKVVRSVKCKVLFKNGLGSYTVVADYFHQQNIKKLGVLNSEQYMAYTLFQVLFKNGLGSYTVGDDQIKGTIRTGAVVDVRHPDKKEYSEATITKIQDCSQYTVVFDDGDITTLRRTALCLKSGKHFAESETLDQLPLTHPEHFSTPVIGGRRGRRTKIGASEASSDEDESFQQSNDFSNFKETDIGRVVCIEGGEKRKNRDNWFPGLIVAPTAQESVPIRVRDEYLVRSFKDGRYYTVPKKEIMEFSRELGAKAETNSLKTAVEKALQFIDRDELPLHWDRDLLLYGATDPGTDSDPGEDNESSDDEPREKKDHFVAQLYKFMDENGTPINEEPVIGSKDVDLFRLYKMVHNLGGFNRVTNQNNWKNVSVKLGFGHNPVIVGMVKQSYRKYLLSFEEWPKRPGCSMQIQPRLSRSRSRIDRNNAIKDRSTSSPPIKNEKEKAVEKATPTISETTAPKESTAKPGPSVAVKEVTLTKPPVTPVTKDKPISKKSAQHATPPSQVKAVSETNTKTPVREIKVETGLKLRNPKQKHVEPESFIIKQEIKEEVDNNDAEVIAGAIIVTPKEKKKRIATKEKQKKDIPMVKGGKVDCLANSRQKRVIKERLKTIAESVKGRSKASTAVITEVVEKSHPSKSKAKDEAALASKINKKEEGTAASAVSDEKRKGRKRKEKAEITLENYDVLPTYKTISLGDKLKVYYGPTREAKITSYEAKVLSTKEENGETLYFVHYTGWNTRYDEWIRANRIADNLSWVAGKASKKQTQRMTHSRYSVINPRKVSRPRAQPTLPPTGSWKDPSPQVSTPKCVKKEKKPSKNENSKGDYKTGSNRDVTGTSSCGSSLSSSKDHQPNRQGSVGRSTTPSSIASSSSRSKATTHKRPTTRAAQTKKDDETTQDFESDVGSELEDSKKITPINADNMESNAPQSKNKKLEPSSRDEILTVVGIPVKEDKDDNVEMKDIKSDAEVCVPAEKSETVDEISDKVEVKSEKEIYEDDNTGAEDETKDDYEDFEALTRDCTVKEESHLQEHEKEDCTYNTVSAVDFDVPSIKDEEEEEEEEEDEEEEYDDEDSKCRSDSENSDRGEESATDEAHPDDMKPELKTEIESACNTDLEQPSDNVTKEAKETAVTVSPNDTDTEDVYEFKEPEPFEFEARKSSDDKAKAGKRAITLSVDDKPSSPKIKRSLSPSGSDTVKTSLFETPADLLKDDTSPESTPIIQTCEEAFDKICASPLRAAALDSDHIAMLEHLESYEDDTHFDDDSEDRLVISERDSDNCSNTSFDKDSEILAAEYSNSATEVNELKASPQYDSQSKEPLSKDNVDDDDDDDDEEEEEEGEDEEEEDEEEEEEEEEEEMEDEAINNAIQTVMNLETSEDSSDEEIIPNEENTVSMIEIESVKLEENESSSENQDLKNSPSSNEEETKADDNSGTDEGPPHLVDETEKDRLEAPIEQEDETQKQGGVIDICPEADKLEENDTVNVEVDGGMMVDLINSETADVEEDENNIESLICEETIPGSPPSHLEVLNQIEEKRQAAGEDIFKTECEIAPSGGLNEQNASQQLVQVVKVEHSPPTTPESEASPQHSPPILPREEPEANTPLLEKKADKEAEVDTGGMNESSSFKKDSSKMSTSDSRSKKVEIKAPTKRGRKSKKKNDDSSTRKKYTRHSKHHGSESDDGYDAIGGSCRADSSRSRSPHPYHHNFLIPAEKISGLDVGQRIVQITQAMQELRTTYNNHKTELATIDKRRKRIRRREREDAARLVNARSH